MRDMELPCRPKDDQSCCSRRQLKLSAGKGTPIHPSFDSRPKTGSVSVYLPR